MRKTDTCWDCSRLRSEVGSLPPIYCQAFPDGKGIPFDIVAGMVRHDRLLGNEKEPVFFEPKGDES